MRINKYGKSGPLVIVLHGGPAAAGNAAPIARGLADQFRVLEPWQRGSGEEPLTVARHVADLHELIESHSAGLRPALVGESWGAMLALAYAAAHPDSVGSLVLIGCGTFDPVARAELRATLDRRKSGDLRERIERLAEEFPDPEQRLRELYRVTESLYSYDPVETDEENEAGPFDMSAHKETWEDMVRLQSEGVYPAAFSKISVPVIMLHGSYDPHPGNMIRSSLEPYIAQLEYHEFERCGHSPWLERAVRGDFFAVLRSWLSRHADDH